jgi:hypothetical protein
VPKNPPQNNRKRTPSVSSVPGFAAEGEETPQLSSTTTHHPQNQNHTKTLKNANTQAQKKPDKHTHTHKTQNLECRHHHQHQQHHHHHLLLPPHKKYKEKSKQ